MSKQCTFDGCVKPRHGKGLCNGHYTQQWRGEELRPLFQPHPQCEAGDGLAWSCIKPHESSGLCKGHWYQSKRGKPFTPINVVTDATARRVMLAANFQPSIPFPGAKKPWPGVCLKCGQPGSPRHTNVKQGQSACGYCSGTKVDTAVAVGKMLAADCQPDGPYPGADKPWPGTCLKCGQPCSPRLAGVQQGDGACRSCANWGIDLNKPTVFYTVAGGGWIKCGITNVPNKRLRKHRNQGLTDVLHVFHFERGHDALALEDLWLERIATIPTFARPTKAELPDGYTEACRDVPMVRRWIEKHLVSLAETNISA